jgi:cytoskeleton protein RodZ
MSDETPAILTDPLTDPAVPRLALGAALRTARKRQELSIEDAAHQLRMSPRQILALEEDNLAALSSPAFVRGFIRNYARLLKLEPEPLLEAYRALQPENGHQAAISLQSEHIAISDGSRKAWTVYALASLLVVALGGGWLFYKDWSAQQPAVPVTAEKSQPAEPQAGQEVAPQPLAEVPAVAVTEPVAAPVPAAESSVPPAPTTAPAATATAVTTVATAQAALTPAPLTPTPAPSAAAIRMVFSEQTWVSVVDSTGKEVFNKTKAAGTEDSADGTPPFKVVIGNANGAKVFYRDKPYDIAPYTKSNVARLTLE